MLRAMLLQHERTKCPLLDRGMEARPEWLVLTLEQKVLGVPPRKSVEQTTNFLDKLLGIPAVIFYFHKLIICHFIIKYFNFLNII